MSHPANTPSITTKLTTLSEKIQWFYSDDFSLDQAEAKYSEAIALAKDIETDLANLKNHIEVISHDFTH